MEFALQLSGDYDTLLDAARFVDRHDMARHGVVCPHHKLGPAPVSGGRIARFPSGLEASTRAVWFPWYSLPAAPST